MRRLPIALHGQAGRRPVLFGDVSEAGAAGPPEKEINWMIRTAITLLGLGVLAMLVFVAVSGEAAQVEDRIPSTAIRSLGGAKGHGVAS